MTKGTKNNEDLCLSFDCGSGQIGSTEPDRVIQFMADTSSKTSAAADTGAYAIVEASGQQFWLQPNRYYDLDRLNAEVDATVTLDNVLLVKDAKGTTLGKPFVKDASVELKVMAHRRGPKVIVYKMRPKKKTRRKNGHRQELTRVMVQSISVDGKAIS